MRLCTEHRLHDWPERLNAVIRKAQTSAFFSGTFDCGHFIGYAVEAVTGYDPMVHFGDYHGENEAVAALERFVGAGPDLEVRTLTKLFGDPLPNVLCAQRGDAAVVDIPIPGGAVLPAFAVVVGSRVYFPRADALGLASLPLRSARLAWKVG